MSAHDPYGRSRAQVRAIVTQMPVAFAPIPVGYPVEILGQAFTVVARTKRGLALRRAKGNIEHPTSNAKHPTKEGV